MKSTITNNVNLIKPSSQCQSSLLSRISVQQRTVAQYLVVLAGGHAEYDLIKGHDLANCVLRWTIFPSY